MSKMLQFLLFINQFLKIKDHVKVYIKKYYSCQKNNHLTYTKYGKV